MSTFGWATVLTLGLIAACVTCELAGHRATAALFGFMFIVNYFKVAYTTWTEKP